MRRSLQRVFLIALALCLSMAASVSLAAQTALEVRAEVMGDAVAATVTLKGDMTASGVQFALAYDDARLRLSGCGNGDLAGNYTINDTEPGMVRLVWYSTEGAPVSGESTVLRLSFTPLGDGEAGIRFDPAAMATMVVDGALSTVDTQTNGATVTINGAGAVSVTTAPAASAEPFSPASTPALTLAPIATPPPSIAPQAAAQTHTPKATPLSGAAQPAPLTPAPVAAVATAPATPQPVPATPAIQSAAAPQIEVLDAPAPAFPWFLVLGGAALLCGAGYALYRRFGKSS